MRQILVIGTFISLVARVPVLGAEGTAPCTLRTATDVVRCAMVQSPEALIGRKSLDQQSKLIESARQRINPEFDGELVPKTGGQSAELSLMHTFELGGKRNARTEVARAEFSLAEKQQLATQEQVAVKTAVTLYRLRQVKNEIALLKEAGDTFSKVIGGYRGRIRLTPAQEVSLSIFEIAARENELHVLRISQEQDRLLAEVTRSIGTSVSDSLLPPVKLNWPDLPPGSLRGGEVQLAEFGLKRAQAGLEASSADAWPDLKVGPKVVLETGDTSETQVGVALSMQLPIYQRNSAGKAAASADVERARLQGELVRIRLSQVRDLFAKRYKASGSAFKQAMTGAKLQERHRSLHRLINQGFVGATEVIELHRQIFEFQTTADEHELSGVEALWSIHALDGRVTEAEIE